MSEERASYATTKDGAQTDRREQDLVGKLVERLGNKIESQAAELERGRIAREQWSQDQTEQEQTIARLTDDLNFHKAVVRDKHREIESLNAQKIRANAEHERELVKVLQELGAVKIAKSAISGDLKKSWRDLVELENQRDGLRKKLEAQRFAADNIEQQRHALALQVADLSGKLVSAGLECDQLRATVAEQAETIAIKSATINSAIRDLETQKQTISEQAAEIYRLKNPQKSSYPMASSYPPPVNLSDYMVTTIEGDKIRAFHTTSWGGQEWRNSESGDVIDRVIAWTKI
jgi:chromosome segregation ATPase